MGIVYRARQPGVGRIVALKVLRQGATASETQVARFAREGRLVAGLRHPGIVTLHEAGVHDGLPYFSMDWIDGRSLDAVLADGLLPVERAVALLTEVARAVGHAHEAGIVHRDLKPSNILVERVSGRPLVTDFGLAKAAGDGETTALTGTGDVLGTPFYMSPEQTFADAATIDARSDVFALGVVLHEALAGRRPFAGRTIGDVFEAIQLDDPPDLRSLRPEVPAAIAAIVAKALEKVPAWRYPTAGALADDLDRARDGRPIVAGPAPLPARLLRALRGRPTVARLLVLVVVVVATGLATRLLGPTTSSEGPPPDPAGPAEETPPADAWRVVFADGFERAEIGPRWLASGGAWSIEAGHLRCRGVSNSGIRFADPVAGDVIVRYRARAVPGRVVCDASAFLLGREGGIHDWLDGYFLGFGSDFNRRSYFRRQGDLVCDAPVPRIEPGRWHRVEASRIGDVVGLVVDGGPPLEYVDDFPIGGPEHVVAGLYTFDGDVEFDDVVILRRRVEERAHPLDVADGLLRAGRFADAEDRYRRYIEDHRGTPLSDQAAYRRALARWRGGDADGAAQLFRSASDRIDDPLLSDLCRLQLARIEIDAGRPAVGLGRIREFLDLHPDRPGGPRFRQLLIRSAFRAHLLEGKPAVAIPFWEEALVRTEGEPWRRSNIARRLVGSLLAAGRPAEAIERGRAFLAEEGGEAQDLAYIELHVGQAFEEQGLVRAALETLAGATARYAEAAPVPAMEAATERARILEASGDLEGALAAYDEAAAAFRGVLSFRRVDALDRAADLCRRTGHLDEALARHETILRDHGFDRPACSRALLRRGDLLAGSGRTAEAEAAWQTILDRYGDLGDAAAARQRLGR